MVFERGGAAEEKEKELGGGIFRVWKDPLWGASRAGLGHTLLPSCKGIYIESIYIANPLVSPGYV